VIGDPFDESEDDWPDEPDEPDPREIGPRVRIPEVPEPGSGDLDADPELFRTFWKLVVVFNLALFAASLGPMLAFFRGRVLVGGGVFLLGIGSFVYGIRRYRSFRRERDGRS